MTNGHYTQQVIPIRSWQVVRCQTGFEHLSVDWKPQYTQRHVSPCKFWAFGLRRSNMARLRPERNNTRPAQPREKKKGAVDRLHARSPKQMQLAGGQIFSW